MNLNQVQEGNYYDGVGFTPRYHEYEDHVCPPGIDQEDYEENYDGDYVYMTSDGKFFLNYDKAQDYQKSVSIPELNEIAEKLEELKVLCNASKDKSPVLGSILAIINQIESDGGAEMLDKYYDSTCY